jgi:1,4-dihydroxy-2-naphthoate octaprenyltransferase
LFLQPLLNTLRLPQQSLSVNLNFCYDNREKVKESGVLSAKVFFELVEIKAKTASVFPFLLGACYSWFHFGKLNILPMIIYFVAMVLFNMFVDSWDNFNDYHNAVDTNEYKQNTNIIGRENIPMSLLKKVMGGMFGVSLILGIITAIMTGWPVLWLGIFCYAVGIFYSWGPKPLSSLPVGEVFSGITMGFVILLITVFINASDIFIWNFATVADVFLVALPNTLLIANLMLANNICDLAEDESNQRFTLVHYTGKRLALELWVLAILVSLIAFVVAAVIGLTPWTMLATFLLLPFVRKQAKKFMKLQVKRETFIVSVKILAVVSAVQVILFFIGILLQK